MKSTAWILLSASLVFASCGAAGTSGTEASGTGTPGTGTGTSGTGTSGTGTPGAGTTVSVQTQPGTFVWLEAQFAHDFPPAEVEAYMDQQGQMFMPDTVLARTGQPVHFRSSEDVLHNVRVIRGDKTPIFNVATPPFGSYTHTFDEPGFYNVTCDIHATMRATVYVTATPYVGTADERGHFTFDNVVPGPYKVAGFADGKPIEKTVEVAGPRVDVTLQ
jgi:plastocyanin